jgi:membrane protease YdiL (CAAX protease family)
MFFEKSKIGENGFLQYFAGLALTFLGIIIGQIPLTLVLFLSGDIAATSMDDLFNLNVNNNLMLILIVLSFAGGLAGLWFAIKFLHRRSFLSLITPKKTINWNKLAFGFTFWLFLTACFELANYIAAPDTYSMQFSGWSFIVLVIVAFLFLPLQTSFEEILFRGYLMQGFGQLFKYRWPALLITSILFGSLHLANPEVGAFGMQKMMFYYIGSGIVLGLITIMDDSLELPLAVHAASNIYAAVLVTYDNSALKTDALFSSEMADVDGALAGFLIMSTLFIVVVARIYRWPSWKHLFTKIEFKNEEEHLT